MRRWRLLVLPTAAVLIAVLFFILVRGDRAAPQVTPEPHLVEVLDTAPSGAGPERRTDAALPVAPAPRVAQDLYFPVRTGARWVYDEDGREFTQVVTAVETDGDAKVISVGRVETGGKVTPLEKVEVSARGLVRLEEHGVRCNPPVHLLETPVRSVARNVEGLPGELLEPLWPAPIARPEEVRVPAGVYRTIRGRTGAGAGEPSGRRAAGSPNLLAPLTETCWYAPKVGLVKRTLTPHGRAENISELVLKAFFPGED